MPICERVHQNRKNNNHLAVYKKSVTSQCGEDGIIEKIIETLPNVNRYCLEFGAWDGKNFSNTWDLTQNGGWTCLYIEANTRRFEQLIINHQDNPRAICMNRFVEYEGENSLDRILEEVQFPIDFDLISIDIDGNDYYVWDSIQRYRPKVVVIEFNPTIPNDIIFVQDRDIKVSQGCSLAALIQLGQQKGYELIATTEWNAFFVLREYYDLFGIEDNAIEYMFDDSKYGMKIFQLYDGTLKLAGHTVLCWKGKKIEEEDIQVLPPEQRNYIDHIENG